MDLRLQATAKLHGTSSSYLSRQVVGKAARVRHIAVGSGQHVAGRMVTGSSGRREREEAEGQGARPHR